MCQACRTELLFILWGTQDGAWHWTQQAAERRHTNPLICVCYVFMWLCAVLNPHDVHPPISHNRAVHEIVRKHWDPYARHLEETGRDAAVFR